MKAQRLLDLQTQRMSIVLDRTANTAHGSRSFATRSPFVLLNVIRCARLQIVFSPMAADKLFQGRTTSNISR